MRPGAHGHKIDHHHKFSHLDLAEVPALSGKKAPVLHVPCAFLALFKLHKTEHTRPAEALAPELPRAGMQVALDAGYKVLWSDMDTAWLKNFFELAPHDRDVVLVDDSEEENEQISDNTCTGAEPLHTAAALSILLCNLPPCIYG